MSENTIKLDNTNFTEEVLDATVPVLVDFWAPWCAPCRMIAPVIEELAGDYAGKIKFGKVNVDEVPDIAARFGISSIPTLIIFKDGEIQDQIIGFTPKPHLKARLDKVL